MTFDIIWLSFNFLLVLSLVILAIRRSVRRRSWEVLLILVIVITVGIRSNHDTVSVKDPWEGRYFYDFSWMNIFQSFVVEVWTDGHGEAGRSECFVSQVPGWGISFTNFDLDGFRQGESFVYNVTMTKQYRLLFLKLYSVDVTMKGTAYPFVGP